MTDHQCTTPPRYQHDCSRCIFLGQYDDADLYFCGKGPNATVIARFSGDGADYTSGLEVSYGSNAALSVARVRAQGEGLLAYNLHQALHYLPAKAPAAFQDELKSALAASGLGQALQLLARDKEAGTTALRAWLDQQTDLDQARFPDQERDTLQDWACEHVTNAQRHLRAWGLPHPAESVLARAMHGSWYRLDQMPGPTAQARALQLRQMTLLDQLYEALNAADRKLSPAERQALPAVVAANASYEATVTALVELLGDEAPCHQVDADLWTLFSDVYKDDVGCRPGAGYWTRSRAQDWLDRRLAAQGTPE
jgi:hypothetical protein